VIGSSFDDEIVGDDEDNTIEGGAGNDLIDNSDGADVVDAGDGNDTCATLESTTNCENTGSVRAVTGSAESSTGISSGIVLVLVAGAMVLGGLLALVFRLGRKRGGPPEGSTEARRVTISQRDAR
jgi:Ca2+-binding RTX toxin-like protein